ncbi:MAG: hypothetical protein M3337_03835 [Actinomycetota bacterium]|nr:hypothetical protein [Actinomycetota bacterium]
MPEGDTIYRAAAALRTALVGGKLVAFDAPRLVGRAPTPGRTIESVRSHGKNLEIVFDDGVVLHTHMRMSGSWHLYRPDEHWRRPQRQMRAALETESWQAVCFNAPVVETYRVPDRRRHPGMGNLGPDLCRPDADLRGCVELLTTYPDREMPVADVLLDQRVLCGVGNVYRSEVLWACELSPWSPVRDVTEREAKAIVDTASQLLRANLKHARRITVADVPGGLAVYGRTAQPCFRCRSTIESTRSGEFARVVYWCPGCQRLHEPVTHPLRREMDPHPAAVRFLADLPWRRTS